MLAAGELVMLAWVGGDTHHLRPLPAAGALPGIRLCPGSLVKMQCCLCLGTMARSKCRALHSPTSL